MKSLLITAVLALGLLGASPAPGAIVHMRDFTFDPETITIRAGQSVEWINDDAVMHSATADDTSWDSGEIDGGRTWSRVFEKPGTYAYYCDDHTYMKATVVVK